MPRLKQRNDSCYYIVDHYRDCNTWQVDRDGVRFLMDAQVSVDDLFPTELFMEMWERRLVYLGPDRKEYWGRFVERKGA